MERIVRMVFIISLSFITMCLLAGCDPDIPVATGDPPDRPTNPYPADGANSVNRILTLSWECSDPDNDRLKFKVMLDGGGHLVGYGSGLEDEYWEIPDTLEPGTEYGWQVTATEQTEARLQSVGGYWKFTTGSIANGPPNEPSNPLPPDLAIDQPLDVDLSWTCTDPDPTDTLSYDVYFGTTDVIPQVSAGQEETTYDPGNLEYDEDYKWYVVARDDYGGWTTGPMWRFTTEAHPGAGDVYAVLTARRDLTWLDPLLNRVDLLTARFDSVYAPIDTIQPLRPPDVSCGQFQLDWEQESKTFSYSQDDPDTEFLVIDAEYMYKVQAGGGVPVLSQMFAMPSCEPYVTSPCLGCDVPSSGFTATWEGTCPGQVRLVIVDINGDSTGVDVVTSNDGSYTFTQQQLSSITNLLIEYLIILIHENRSDINAAGYDPRSYISSRIVNTTSVYFSAP